MHDIKAIRENPEHYDANWARRGLKNLTKSLLEQDEELRAIKTQLQALQAEVNAMSAEVGNAKRLGREPTDLMHDVRVKKEEINELEQQEREKSTKLELDLLSIPNQLDDAAPNGASEDDNKIIRTWGEVTKPTGDDHVTIGEKLGLIDFEAAAKMSGARFVVLKGALARMERALAQYMLDTHTGQNGYTEVSPPLLVNKDSMYGTGQFPKFSEDMYGTLSEEDLETASKKMNANTNKEEIQSHVNDFMRYLIPTAEVPLTNLVRETILDEDKLPLRFTAFTPCFRSEAGSAGRDTRGMLRQHQFYKVEMVSITTPEQSADEHARMTDCAERILQGLKIPYRVMDLCAGDIGFGSKRTYDLEAWLPGQEKYREISSCSTCGDFQARRMNARARKAGDKQTRFVHTLNGSGVAIGRCLIAVMENYWDGQKIIVPEVLRPYMGGLTSI